MSQTLRGSRRRAAYYRPLRGEPLEDRRLLSVASPTVDLFNASPALFVANQGQWADPAVRYLHQGDGADVAMTDAGPVFEVFRSAGPSSGDTSGPGTTEALRFSAGFVGANPVTPVGLDPAATTFNYLLGPQSGWHSNVPSYQTVAYEGLYPGVDLVSWGRRSNLKYEFHVAPGADYRQIAVHYSGVDHLALTPDGQLHVSLGGDWGELTDAAPVIYQLVDGRQVPVAGQYVLLDSNIYTFALTGPYDPTRELVIDPDLAWATYLGGSGYEFAQSIALDGAANVYVTGAINSDGLATPGAYDSSLEGTRDVFVAKFDPTGSQLLYCTYLGGSDDDSSSGIAVDEGGNAYVTGQTRSGGWATPGAFDTSLDANTDAFVAKLASAGDSLLYCTYLGGTGWDAGNDLAINAAGDAFVTGRTWSTLISNGTPGTPGQTVGPFVAEVDPSGGNLLYCTYLGGYDGDQGTGIAVDGTGNAYVVGSTTLSGLATAGAWDTTYNGYDDAFVARIAPGSGTVLQCTYLGGANSDDGGDLAIDTAGNVYATGTTWSDGWATPGVFDGDNSGGTHKSFVAKLNPTLSNLGYCTYLGTHTANALAVDAGENVYLAGETPGDWVPWLSGRTIGIPPSYLDTDALLGVLSADASRFLVLTRFGGIRSDVAHGLTLDSAGNAFVAGVTESSDWATPGAYDTSYNGLANYDLTHAHNDAFVAKITGVDTVGVTINQASAQPDPATVVPIHFTAVFSKPVVDFDASSITLYGNAPGMKVDKVELVAGTDATYDIQVSATAAGSIAPQVQAGQVHTVAGGLNFASDSTDNSVSFLPDVQIIDNDYIGLIGAWWRANGQGCGGDVDWAVRGTGESTATWTFPVRPGQYRLAATWTEASNRATNAQYTVYDGTTLVDTVEANQRAAPKDFTDGGTPWEYLDYVNISGNSLVVQLSNKANKYVIADAVRIERVGDVAPLPVQIVDSGDAGFSASAAWSSVAGDGYLDDLSYGYRAGSGQAAEKATWSFDVAPGQYRVSTTWSPYKNRATNAPYTASDGTASLGTVEINQRLAPADFTEHGVAWEDLGTFNVTGSTLVVTLSNQANKYVIADAVRIERIGDAGVLPLRATVDDGDAAFALKGAWEYSPQGYLGGVWYSPTGTSTNVARWAFDVTPGEYEIWTTWTPYSNRATHAAYAVYDGSQVVGVPVEVDQTQTPADMTQHSTGWKLLGTFSVTGSSLIVRLSDVTDPSSLYMVADAVQIEQLFKLTVDAASAPAGNAAVLTGEQLASITDEAIRRMTVSEGAAAKLAALRFEIADLPPGVLGEEAEGVVRIDRDAAGYGWFVDPTPREDEEFASAEEDSTIFIQRKSGQSPAATRVDLLTAVMHELGHALGYSHTTADSLMHPSLPLGARRM